MIQHHSAVIKSSAGCMKGVQKSFLLRRIPPIRQPIKTKLDTMTGGDRRNLHPNFYNDEIIIDDVTIRFVIMKILHSASHDAEIG